MHKRATCILTLLLFGCDSSSESDVGLQPADAGAADSAGEVDSGEAADGGELGDGGLSVRPAPPDDPGAEVRIASGLRAPANAQQVDLVIEALARAGVRVYEDDATSLIQEINGLPSIFKFLRSQAASMALEPANGLGTSGHSIDVFAAAPPASPFTMAQVIGAYAKSGDTFGARLSRELLLGADFDHPDSVVFPTLVIALFLADLYPHELGFSGGRSPIFADTPCGVINDFLNNAARIVEDEIRAQFDGTFGTILATALAAIVNIAIEAARAALEALTAPLQKLAVLVHVVSLLRDWTLTPMIMPGAFHYQVGSGAPVRGTVAITVGNFLEYPSHVRDCAAVAGVSLPDTMPEGSMVTWTALTGIPQHAAIVEQQDVVQPGNTAQLTYQASVETEEQHANGPLHTGPVAIMVTVSRGDVAALAPLIGSLLGNRLVAAIASALAGPVLQELAALVGPETTLQVAAMYHTDPNATIHRVITDQATIIIDAHSCTGAHAPWTGTIDIIPGGEDMLSWDLTAGPDAFSWSVSIPDGTHNGQGTVSVTPDGMALQMNGTVTVVTPKGSAMAGFGEAIPIVYGPNAACP